MIEYLEMKFLFLLCLIILIGGGILVPKLIIQEDKTLSQVEIACAKTQVNTMLNKQLDRILIQRIATVSKDGENITLNAYTFWGIKYSQLTVVCKDQPDTTILDTNKCAQLNEFCGGIAGILCCERLKCNYDGDYPDSGGICLGER